ncbi:MAG: hypothetical protein SGPRY_005475, partial [Prymnesium sp.]
FVQWLERSSEDVCRKLLLPDLKPQIRKDKCEGYTPCGTQADATACGRYDSTLNTDSLHLGHHTSPYSDPCELSPHSDACATYARLVIVQDPFSRLIASFLTKLDETSGNQTRFQELYLRRYALNSAEPALVRFFKAVLATPESEMNENFMSQSAQCFQRKATRTFTFAASLQSSNDEDLDALSAFMESPLPWRSVIRTAKSTTGNPPCWLGCRKYTRLIVQLRERFADDVINLRALGHPDYNQSFNTAISECLRIDRVCNSLHDAARWSTAVGSSADGKRNVQNATAFVRDEPSDFPTDTFSNLLTPIDARFRGSLMDKEASAIVAPVRKRNNHHSLSPPKLP